MHNQIEELEKILALPVRETIKKAHLQLEALQEIRLGIARPLTLLVPGPRTLPDRRRPRNPGKPSSEKNNRTGSPRNSGIRRQILPVCLRRRTPPGVSDPARRSPPGYRRKSNPGKRYSQNHPLRHQPEPPRHPRNQRLRRQDPPLALWPGGTVSYLTDFPAPLRQNHPAPGPDPPDIRWRNRIPGHARRRGGRTQRAWRL